MPRNTSVIKNLIQTLQREVKPDKLYDALDRINEDLTQVFDAVFTGPLPVNSGENLDLTKVPKDKFPPNVAYVDEDNEFEEPQTIEAVLAAVILKNKPDSTSAAGDKWGRVKMPADDQIILSANLDWDGTDYDIDDGAFASGFVIDEGGDIALVQYDGADAFYPLRVADDRIIRLGNPTFFTDAAEDEIVIMTEKSIRSTNSAEDRTISMIQLDAADLVYLGIDADPDGTGHVGIPTVVDTDLPAAAAGQNGTIVIDKTNNRFCFYHSGLRYRINGTAF